MFCLEYPDVPIMQTSRLIVNQAATVKCVGGLGKHIGPTDMILEMRLEDQQAFTTIVDGVISNTDFNPSVCSHIKTLEYQFITQSNMANAVFMCRTTSPVGDYSSDSVTISVDSQGKFVYSLYTCLIYST